MFRDDEHKAHACRLLLQTVGLDHLWTHEGPTPNAMQLRASDGGTMHARERTVFFAVWSLWSGSGASVGELVRHLDEQTMATVCALLIAAVSPTASAVDEWIALYGESRTQIGRD
jgi:hypothetical protein